MAIDKEAIKEHVRGILVALGDDPDREGLKETPDRVARMYEEVFEGMNYSNHEIAQKFSKTFEDDLSVKCSTKCCCHCFGILFLDSSCAHAAVASFDIDSYIFTS